MTSTSTLTMVACSECGHDNEAERVYCHSCGARLDRSAVRARKENSQDAQRRVKKLFDPQRARLRILFFKIGKVVLASLGVAVVLLLLSPPDVPAPSKADLVASRVRNDLEGAAIRHQPAQVQYSDEQVNAFVFYALKPKQKSLDLSLLDFKRAVVGFREGSCAFTVERSLFGFSLYTTAFYGSAVKEGKVAWICKGGQLGRLPVHPQLAQSMGLLFADVSAALDRDAKLVAKMGAVEFHDKMVVLMAPSP